jgi:hypothetical protein
MNTLFLYWWWNCRFPWSPFDIDGGGDTFPLVFLSLPTNYRRVFFVFFSLSLSSIQLGWQSSLSLSSTYLCRSVTVHPFSQPSTAIWCACICVFLMAALGMMLIFIYFARWCDDEYSKIRTYSIGCFEHYIYYIIFKCLMNHVWLCGAHCSLTTIPSLFVQLCAHVAFTIQFISVYIKQQSYNYKWLTTIN